MEQTTTARQSLPDVMMELAMELRNVPQQQEENLRCYLRGVLDGMRRTTAQQEENLRCYLRGVLDGMRRTTAQLDEKKGA